MSQLSLNIALLDGFDFDSFYPMPDNRDALALLHSTFWQSFLQVYLFGESGGGKSHLLQACCYQAQVQGGSAAYLSLRQLSAYGARVLDGLDQCALLALDDLDVIIGDLEWETALFHLINRCRENNQPLLLAGQKNPYELECELPDLASRLVWGPTYRIRVLDEARAIEAFKWRAYKRGLDMSDYIVKYIAKRFPCNIRSLMILLERLDTASLNKGRKITRNLIQEIFPPDSFIPE